MCAAFRQARSSDYAFGGVHRCCCGAISSSWDHFLPDGTTTNSLCVHYVAHHRSWVPENELAFIDGFKWGEADPNEDELKGPALMMAGALRRVERSLGETAARMWRNWGLDVEELASALLSPDGLERESAEQLFELLRFFSAHLSLLFGALKRLEVNPAPWGADALRLPNWDRAVWLAPMLELLQSSSDDRWARKLGFHFRLLRTKAMIIPQELVTLSCTATGERRAVAILAINGLSGA